MEGNSVVSFIFIFYRHADSAIQNAVPDTYPADDSMSTLTPLSMCDSPLINQL